MTKNNIDWGFWEKYWIFQEMKILHVDPLAQNTSSLQPQAWVTFQYSSSQSEVISLVWKARGSDRQRNQIVYILYLSYLGFRSWNNLVKFIFPCFFLDILVKTWLLCVTFCSGICGHWNFKARVFAKWLHHSQYFGRVQK